MEDALSALDENDDGVLDKDELRALSERLGCALSDDALERTMIALDVDGQSSGFWILL